MACLSCSTFTQFPGHFLVLHLFLLNSQFPCQLAYGFFFTLCISLNFTLGIGVQFHILYFFYIFSNISTVFQHIYLFLFADCNCSSTIFMPLFIIHFISTFWQLGLFLGGGREGKDPDWHLLFPCICFIDFIFIFGLVRWMACAHDIQLCREFHEHGISIYANPYRIFFFKYH